MLCSASRKRSFHAFATVQATFGDPTTHADYHAHQLSGYINRFDAGLVIYWFGFDESIDNDPRLLVLDGLLLSDVELMTCLAAGEARLQAPKPSADCCDRPRANPSD